MLNHHKIALLYKTLFIYLLTGKSYNYKILISDNVKKQLGSGLRFLAGSGFYEYDTETLVTGPVRYYIFFFSFYVRV